MKKNSFFPLFILFSLIVSVLIGIRSFDFRGDTKRYVEHFNKSITDYDQRDGFEPGFELLMFIIVKSGASVKFFFFLVALIITSLYLLIFNKIGSISKKNKINFSDFSIFFTCLLISNWYLTLTTNGIRQGISIALLYFALYFWAFQKNKVKFIIYFLLAVSFHYSSIMILPFIILFRLKIKSLFFLWITIGVFYILGINEQLILLISESFNLPLYEFIKLFSIKDGQLPGTGLYEGFDILFFSYTIFWPILLIFIIKLFPKRYLNHDSNIVMKILSCYLILCLPYFIFGFGPFSNRYAFFSWFFVPMMHYFIISSLYIDKLSEKLSYSFVFFALTFFCIFQLNWKSLLF